MSKIVDNYARDRAVDAAIDVLKHQSNRLWDRMTELDAMLGRAQDPAKVLAALQEFNGLIGGMRTCVHVWKSMRDDRLAHENDNPEPLEISPPVLSKAGRERLEQEAPACICINPFAGIHTEDCPRGKWITAASAAATTPTAEAPADIPDCDIPF